MKSRGWAGLAQILPTLKYLKYQGLFIFIDRLFLQLNSLHLKLFHEKLFAALYRQYLVFYNAVYIFKSSQLLSILLLVTLP